MSEIDRPGIFPVARIGDEKLVQRVGSDLVIVDEGSGEEVILTIDEVGRLMQAITVLYPNPGSPFVPPSQVRIAILKWLKGPS